MDVDTLAREYAAEHTDDVGLLCNVCDHQEITDALAAAYLAGYQQRCDEVSAAIA